MSADIGPGSWVQCIRAECGAHHWITVGDVYCVERLDDPDDLIGCRACGNVSWPGLHLVGVDLPWTWGAFCPCHFRPLGGNRSEQSKRASTPAPPREVETV